MRRFGIILRKSGVARNTVCPRTPKRTPLECGDKHSEAGRGTAFTATRLQNRTALQWQNGIDI
jgi:hypothetical protein